MKVPDIDTSYHDYRNFSINDLQLAIEEILSRGAFVFRIGNVVQEELKFSHPRLIDYSKDSTPFMDIYLVANSKFVLGNPSGITDISIIYGVPRLGVNIAPSQELFLLGRNSLLLPKKLKSSESGINLPYSAMFRAFPNGLGSGEIYHGHKVRDKGFIYEKNTPQEIYEATLEMFDRLEGKYKPNSEEKELEEQYRRFLERHLELLGGPFENEFERMKLKPLQITPIAMSFLKKNKDLFEIPNSGIKLEEAGAAFSA